MLYGGSQSNGLGKGIGMNENQYPSCLVWAYLAWVATVALILAAWVVMLIPGDHWRVAFLLGGSGCALSAIAATLHIRSFMVRLCSLIRASTYRDVDGHGLQSVG